MNKNSCMHENGIQRRRKTPYRPEREMARTACLVPGKMEEARYCVLTFFLFARRCLYRLMISRLARAGVIMSGALTSIDVV